MSSTTADGHFGASFATTVAREGEATRADKPHKNQRGGDRRTFYNHSNVYAKAVRTYHQPVIISLG